MSAHYLNSPGSEWEYNENSRTTGKPVRRRFPVPRYLDPRDPADWTNKWGNRDDPEGEIVVCYEDRGNPGDIIYTGDPTPDMSPIDDEAKTISASFEERWRYKPQTSETSFSQALVDQFQSEMADITARPVQIEGLSELATAVAAMAKSNADLIESFARRKI